MTIDVVKKKWQVFFSEIRTSLNKRRDPRPSKEDIKRQEFVRILQKRYGYTKEKAEAEMSAHYSGIILN